MDVMMHRTQSHNTRMAPIRVDYLEQTAHSVEVQREVNEKGELGSFGFTLVQERPPVVGTIVPGGPADKAGLKKNDVVIAVNNNDTTNCSHQEVVSIIAGNPTTSIWLTVCEPADSPHSHLNQRIYDSSPGRTSFLRTSSSGMSQSNPMIHRNFSDSRRTFSDDTPPPPKYFEATRNQRSMNSSPRSITTSNVNMSPLTQQVLRPNQNGHQNGPSLNQQIRGHSDYSLHTSPPSPTPSPSVFTSANVLVLYIGPVEIPQSWRVRELSSRCLQECTRQLLSQRQEFLEVFLEVNLKSLKILKVDQGILFQHPREELYYCGVCTDDEQYFGIVTKKEQKGSKKGSQSNGHQSRAHMCHVFKVMQSKSVLILKTGETKLSPKNSKSLSTPVKPKTITITSCVTIINALQGLFTSDDVGGSKLFSESSSLRGSSDQSLKVAPSLTSFYSNTSASSGGSGGSSESVSSPEKSKKKLDVIDLRPSAFTPKSGTRSILNQSAPQSNPNMYVAVNSSSHNHSRSYSKEDFPSLVATPAYYHQRQGSGNNSWYSVDSPKENRHSRENSWDNRENRPVSGNYEKYTVQVPNGSGSSGGRASGSSGKQSLGIHFDQYTRDISDNSSISSMSDSCTSSPSRMSLKSPFHSGSHSPSPPQSLSYSSGSASPVRRYRSPSPGPIPRAPRYRTPSVSKLSAGLALETPSRRYRASSPATSFVSSRVGLRRQGSESSIMEMQDTMSPYRSSLPPKSTGLTSSIGSVATLTTIADNDVNDPEECGRVGGWVASFDKLLADPMGVQCLLHFLEKEHCEENILFWRDAQDFKAKAPQTQNLQEAVKKIYDQYLAPTSPNTVNVDDRVLKGVESRLSNPPLNVFYEAQDQIYRLMKMDCYPRFKKSDIIKECLLAEMEGKPLPVDPSPQPKAAQTQFNGIWKNHRGRSLFSKLGRKVQHEQQQHAANVWGVSPEGKSPDSGKKGNKKGGISPRSGRSATVKESSKSRLNGAPEGKAKGSSHDDGAADDFPPGHHLDIFKAHKRNVFEVNLPNKVTKIMQVPDRATVRDAIQPVLKKYGYSFEIMELRFANTFRLIDLSGSADVLIGQHIIVTKSKNTFIAAFPDVIDKILPADGSKSVGELFVNVLKEMDKLQNFQIYCEGSRVPLELTVDTSVLVGQRVIVKYLPGPCTFVIPSVAVGQNVSLESKHSKSSLNSSNSSGEKADMDDLFSKIFRLATDELVDQRTSPTPRSTPEPESIKSSPGSNPRPARSSEDLLDKHSPTEMRRRAQSQGKRQTNSTGHSHQMLTVSKSIDVFDGSHHGHHKSSRSEREKRSHHHHQRRSTTDPKLSQSSGTKFKRVQSGSSVTNSQKLINDPGNRSLSPPPNIGYNDSQNDHKRRSNTSPPPPTSRPPPLPNNAGKRLSGGRPGTNMANSRWSGTSFKSTDSASSEESDPTRYSKHRNIKHSSSEHTYINRASATDHPQFFPQAHPSGDKRGDGGPIYVNGSTGQDKSRSYQRNRPINLSSLSKEKNPRPSMMPSPPRDDSHPLDNVVNEAYSHQRKPTHPLQNARAQPHSKSGTNLSSYPWHTAHVQQQQHQQRKTSVPLRSSKDRKNLTENPDLVQRGNNLIAKEIDEYRTHSDASSSHSGNSRVPLSPTTHTLMLPDEPGCETFV